MEIPVDFSIEPESKAVSRDIALEEDKMNLSLILKDNLVKLNPSEETVLNRRFGLYGCRTGTLEEVGKELGLTRERIRQIESEALRKLKKYFEGKKDGNFPKGVECGTLGD